MNAWFTANWPQMVGVASVIIVLVFGRKAILPRVQESKFLLWLAWLVTAACGLVLLWSLIGVMRWLTSLPGTLGGVVSSIGAVVAVAAGWWSAKMLVAMVRDLADGVPDEDARKAALWHPLLAVSGLQAVWGLVQNPRGIGTGITAAVIAVISLVAIRSIVSAALKGKKGETAWKWFACAVCLLGGILNIPLIAFADTQIQQYAPEQVSSAFRILAGVLGAALLLAGIADLVPKRDKGEKRMVPDGFVRNFLLWGLPALFLFGSVAVGTFAGNGESGGQILIGSVR